MAARDEDDDDEHGEGGEERVSPLELFFDLVFVFSITQVTASIAADPTWLGLVRAMLVLAVVWWAWVSYSWLTNSLDTNENSTRVVMFVAMGGMFVVAMSISGAFEGDGLLFAGAYFVVRAAHILLYAHASDDGGAKAAVLRTAPATLAATSLLVGAAAVDQPWRDALWIAAVLIDFAGPALAGLHGWRLHPDHFAERHGLIIIIAFGESIIATGLASGGVSLSFQIVLAALLALTVTATLWWAYFDVAAPVAERKLHETDGLEQLRMARDAYSYIHLVMVAGIVLLALGSKKAITGVDEPLKTVPALALCGGVALYLLGHVAFRLRVTGGLSTHRLVVAAGCLALTPLATHADAVVALGAIGALCGALIAYEVMRARAPRVQQRGRVAA
jgi:low temperature requirement protein LtrA